MPRGGRRTGTPGKAYGNRSDLNVPAAVASGQQYGKRAEQVAAQRAVPMARPATDAVPTAPPRVAAPASQAPSAPQGPMPGQLVPLDAPSQRPGEPVTAGLPVGPGAGAEANPFRGVGTEDDAIMALRAAYSAYPSEALRAILERIDLP